MGVLRSVRGAAWGYTRVQRRAAAVPGMSAVGIIFMMPEFYFPTQNVKLNHYIAVFERVVLLCKICEQQTSNRIESLAIESGCIRE